MAVDEKCIDEYIQENLNEDAQRNALAFVANLRTNEMLFERGEGY